MMIGYTRVPNDLLKHLLVNAVDEENSSKPSFVLDEAFGEGTAPGYEREYREELLVLLSGLFLAFRDVLEDKSLSLSERQIRIDALTEAFRGDGVARVDQFLNKIYSLGEGAAGKEILAAGLYPGRGMDASRLMAIAEQQRHNINLVANLVRDGALQQVNIQYLESQYRYPKGAERFKPSVNGVFRDSAQRLDRMGVYGATYAYAEGKLNVYRAYEDSLLLDWVSMRDRKVCQTCRLYESRGPYKPSEYPPVPHVGCRCYPVISVVDGEPFDAAGLFVLDYLTE